MSQSHNSPQPKTRHLRADNVDAWDPAWFEKADLTADDFFYQLPRKVVHIDDSAIAAVTALYRQLLPANGEILDLMSSWRSHLPGDVHYARVVGLGMNADEMAENAQLSEFVLHNLNAQPQLPFPKVSFDAACCCVSVQYLQQPVAVFRSVQETLRVGSPFVVTFSNRCFPSKAINLWRYTSDDQHVQLVALYFAASGGWSEPSWRLCNEIAVAEEGANPLYAVWAEKVGG